MAENQTIPTAGQSRRGEWLPLCLLLSAGLLISMLPHLLQWVRTGDATWVCDTDELVPYGQLIAHSYQQHPWKLGDPALPSGGASMYPWIQFVPWILLSKAMNLGPVGVLMLMRVFAGLSLGLAMHLLSKRPGNRIASFALALIALSDCGLTGLAPLYNHWAAVLKVITGSNTGGLNGWGGLPPAFRLITPGLSFIGLGLALFSLIELRAGPTSRKTWLAGIAFGYCVASYFYFWTAVGGAIALLALIDRKNWKRYLIVLLIGGALGSPALIQNFLTKAAYGEEWLARNEYFVRLSSPSHSFPKKLVVGYLLTGFAVWRWNQRLTPIWLTGLVALALSQSHELTQIWMQPWHWTMAAAMLNNLIVLHLGLDLYERWIGGRRWGSVLLIALATSTFAGALILRGWSSQHNLESARMESGRQAWLELLAANPTLRLEPGSVIGGDTSATDWAVIYNGVRPLTGATEISPSVNNLQWLRRRVLNGFLRGATEDSIKRLAYEDWGVVFNLSFLSPTARQEEMADVALTWREFHLDPEAELDRQGVRYLVLPPTSAPPHTTAPTWTRIAASPSWQVWERKR